MLQPLTDNDPRQIGPYRLQSRIGAGGMGTVYLGFADDNKPVAVKVPSPGLADSPEFRDRFRTEVTAAARVRGMSVAAVIDADTAGPRPWMATEYVEGRSLTEAVALRGPFTGRLLDGLAVGLADALVAIHTAGVIHRDLKPSNILVTWEGPKVIDFGIARSADSTSHTRTGVLVGTLVWMAPEQLRGERAGPPTDVFAWGACVAFAATGRQPFRGERPEAIAIQIMTAEPDLTGVPPALRAVLAWTLDKEPARRPTAAALVAALLGRDATDPDETVRAAHTALAQWWSLPPTPPQAPSQAPAEEQADTFRSPTYRTRAGDGPPRAMPHQQPGPHQQSEEPYREPPPKPSRPRRRGTFTVVLATILALALIGGIATALALRGQNSPAGNGGEATVAGQTPAAVGGVTTTFRGPTPPAGRTATVPPPVTPPRTTTQPPTHAPLTLAEASNIVNAQGFTVIDHTGFAVGRNLNVLIGQGGGTPSTPSTPNSASGTPRQSGFFFVGTDLIGKDFSEPSAGIHFVSATQTTVVLRYDLYEPADKACCPSGGTTDVVFHWDGRKLNVDPASIPPNDPNAHGSRR
ncbi:MULTISPECIES: protein kinase [unclassified Frankia]|uniref:protein kinase domain-containing protein n=1 Tax=unclassified Frankia TaxID=2632575 RepID=UPI001EF6A707|nr:MULTISPECIES: protein kinase [unclassified Frankia]